MSSGLELAHIGKVEVLSDEETMLCLGGRPNFLIFPSGKTFLPNIVYIMV